MNDIALLDRAERAVEKARPSFMSIAPHGKSAVSWESEMHYALQILRGNSYLCKADPQTIQDAVVNVAAVGLSLNPALKHAALVPRKSPDGRLTCCLDVMFQGLIHLATTGGRVISVRADVVRERDREEGNFRYSSGTSPCVIHNPDPFMSDAQRGAIIGAYCVAELQDSKYPHVTFMSIEELHAVRDKSEMWKAKKSGPWKDFEAEMCKKSVIKRAQKSWPKGDAKLATAIALSNVADGYFDEKAIEGESVELVSEDEAQELRSAARRAHLRVDRIYQVYSITKMEQLPKEKLKECRERIQRAELMYALKTANKETVIAAADWGLTLKELNDLGAEVKTEATIIEKRDE